MNDQHTATLPALEGVVGVLALELGEDPVPAHAALDQNTAGRLAGLVGRDLDALAPGVRDLELAFAAAHFDPAEILRPGWPVHRRLHELRQRAPGAKGPRIIAFGADADGDVPLPLQCDRQLLGGRLRCLPFLLSGDAAGLEPVQERMEAVLLDLGMAAPDTALLAQDAFGTRIEHARYLTVHDLLAMTALQYEHLGLAPLWPLIETALLSPAVEATLDAPPEPLLRYVDGEARLVLFAPDAWRERYRPDGEGDALRRHFARFEMRQRQLAAVLEAHGISVSYDHADPL